MPTCLHHHLEQLSTTIVGGGRFCLMVKNMFVRVNNSTSSKTNWNYKGLLSPLICNVYLRHSFSAKYRYWFQTLEGWTIDGHFRSLIYMRPLSIWGMQYALSLPKAILEAPKINVMDRIHISPGGARSSHNETGVRKIAKKASCLGNTVFHCAC